MVKVTNLYQFLAVFPPDLVRNGEHQFDTPCPFCGEGDSVEYLGHTFYGDNRMFWVKSNDTPRAICRQCMAANRGPHHGVYFYADFVAKFGDELDIDESTPALKFEQDDPYTSGELQLPDLIQPIKRIAYFNAVDRAFWSNLGFTDETINHFYLGYGRLYSSWDRGHLIPMEVRTADQVLIGGHYYEARMPDPERPGKYLKKNSTGGKKHIFWHVAEGDPADGVLITESPKNQIAHWQMGFLNSVATFGAGVWKGLPDNFKYLGEHGYRKVYVVGDHDDAGAKFNAMIIEQALKTGFECYFLEWQPSMGKGYDTADLMKDLGTTAARQYMDANFVEYVAAAPENQRAEFIPNYTTVDPNYVPRKITPVTIEEVRGDGERSIKYAIHDFLKHYLTRRKYGRGDFLLLAVRPGTGKTHALIQTAEAVAKKSMERKFDELHKLEDEITRVQGELDANTDFEEQEALRNLLGNLVARHSEFSFQSVFWGAQYKDSLENLLATGANPQYYYDFQARNPENCENIELAGKLAMKGHNLMKFCEDSCPFAERCRKMGYLSQYNERRNHPIGVYRHQHLVVESALDGYRDLVIIDESPMAVVETAVTITSEECEPSSPLWENYVEDAVQADALRYFASGLQHTLRFNLNEPNRGKDGELNPGYMVSGTSFLRLIDSTIKHLSEDAWDLSRVMSEIDEKAVRRYQMNSVGDDAEDIPPIRLPQVYKVIAREFDEYTEDPNHKRPSCLHLVSGTLEAYPMSRIHISSNTPVIVADATALMPELYTIALGRDLASLYAPDVYNDKTDVEHVHGSDWTISNIQREIGHILARKVNTITDAAGNTVSLQNIWEDSALTNNRLVRMYLDVITSYALQHKSDGLLVVLHKKIRGVIEPMMRSKLPRHKLAFAHYGGVRGSNLWKDYAAALLMGTPRVPYDVLWRKIQAWANMSRITDPIPFELGYLPTSYDGTNSGHTHINFLHPFAAKYVDLVEMGEATQAQERVRPHSSHEHKKIILFSSRPIGTNVTRLTGKTRLLRSLRPENKLTGISEYVVAKYEEGGALPSKRSIMSEFECSHKTASEGFNLALEKLQLDPEQAANS